MNTPVMDRAFKRGVFPFLEQPVAAGRRIRVLVMAVRVCASRNLSPNSGDLVVEHGNFTVNLQKTRGADRPVTQG